jgi:hypothetical protein
VVGWQDVVEQEVADVVILPVNWVVTRVRASVAPVAAEVVALVGGAGAGQ